MTKLGMYLDGDIRNVIRGLAVVASAMPPGDYRKGYETALVAVAVAFGLESSKNQEGIYVIAGYQ